MEAVKTEGSNTGIHPLSLTTNESVVALDGNTIPVEVVLVAVKAVFTFLQIF